ncbi:hypothetical protein INT43_002548 [Umbelopsis isabellina]|uniref:Spore coat protein CotH n=1 Tax=Mortierella isabellina TaxID=91625 RepID=A0A8H7UK46_MORIS|nr:hypothetical protein INT43_002548 [Umbelopsis isabellina]
MIINSFLTLTQIIIVNSTAVITYNVVVPPDLASHVVGVAINDDIYPLTANPDAPMLYSGNAPGETSYRYVIVDSLENKVLLDFEKFQRPAINTLDRTYNEVFGRAWNQLSLPSIPKMYDYPYPVPESKLFEEGTIASIHFRADQAEVDKMHTQFQDEIKVKGVLTYINYDSVQTFDNVKIKIGGHSTRNWAKVPYKVKISKKSSADGLYGRHQFKLRSEATDPTMVREKLYADMLTSMGVITSKGTYARFYINDRSIGIFLLVDNIASKEFVRETVHANEDVELGTLVKGDAGKGDFAANLNFVGPNPLLYDPKTYEVKSEIEPEGTAMQLLIDFMSFIQGYQPTTNEADIKAFSARIDMTSFMRSMVLEWLTGNWDGHAYSGNNYALYQHPTSMQYLYLPMDFDFTFGNGLEKDQDAIATGKVDEFTQNRPVHSFLYDKVMRIPAFQEMYNTILYDAITKVFNLEVTEPRMNALTYMLQHEVNWDHSLKRQSVGIHQARLDIDYLATFDQGTGDIDMTYGLREWIKLKEQVVKIQFGLIPAPAVPTPEVSAGAETDVTKNPVA